MRVSFMVVVYILWYSGVASWNMVIVSSSKVKMSDTMHLHDQFRSVSVSGPFRKGAIPVQKVQTTDEHPMVASRQMRKTKDAAIASDSEFTSKRLL